jgi:hypothetical protein
MPVKKRADKVRTAHKITPEAVEAFRAAMETRATYLGCMRGEGCHSPNQSTHCKTCRRYLDACGALHMTLDLPPWAPLPDAAETDEPPPARGALDPYVAGWPLARRLRLELERAVRDHVSE